MNKTVIIHSLRLANLLLENGCVMVKIITDADNKQFFLNFVFERSPKLEKLLDNYVKK